jgi:predicted DsbA family dithiol-disulfide isomerase
MPAPRYIRDSAHSGTGDRLRQMARESGREIVLDREWLVNSRRALEASEYAREQGKHGDFHRVVFGKFYGEGQDISRWDVLHAAAEEVGLDPDEMQRQTESGRYKEKVDATIERAHALGITGVPAYVVGDRYLIMGAQPYEVFQEVMERLEHERLSETEVSP